MKHIQGQPVQNAVINSPQYPIISTSKMSENLLEVLAEEALGTLHGLPPGMFTAARMVGVIASSAQNKPEKRPSQSRIETYIDSNQLNSEEIRLAGSLASIASKTIAKEYGTQYSRTKREQMAAGTVKAIAEAPGSISSQDATETLFSGNHEERIQLIHQLSQECNR